jgi:hypothetical protein
LSYGIGGFVIIGESAGDHSGRVVSSAGDVNGDGLDDLIVGADSTDQSGKTNKLSNHYDHPLTRH